MSAMTAIENSNFLQKCWPSIKTIHFEGKTLGSARSKGTIKKWLDDKGFGFIKPDKDSKDVFVHISAFDRAIPRKPKVGDTIFYYVHTDKDGKTKAVDAIIEGVAPVVKKKTIRPKSSSSKSGRDISKKLLLLCTIVTIGLGVTLYKNLQTTGGQLPFSSSELSKIFKIPENINQLTKKYTCRGKTRCAQMTSCAEAKFYIRNCPGTKMDGDGDGIPCERQWCN